MQKLNFPTYPFQLKTNEKKTFIFDIIRKKYVVLTPEEWVRQHCIWFLIHEKNYPKSLINVEKQLIINGLKKRTDIIVFNNAAELVFIIECKAPSVTIDQKTFDQIARYNLALNAHFLLLTNGLNHYICQMNHQEKSYHFLKEVPPYKI